VAPPSEWKRNWRFLLFAGLGLIFWPQLNIKAVCNLKIVQASAHTMGYLFGNFRICRLLFLVSEVSCGEECALFWRFPLFCRFLKILPQLKRLFFKNLSARIIVQDAIFLPNLTFLGLVNPEISFGEKQSPTVTPTHHPAYFAIREPQCSALTVSGH